MAPRYRLTRMKSGQLTRHNPIRRRPGPAPRPVADRFWRLVSKSDECWTWTGVFDRGGYGQFGGHGAHRVAYELSVGPIPEGLTIDHLCRNTRCVNPAHLEPVTLRENILRGSGSAPVFAKRTRCARGHTFAGANLAIRPDGARRCRACENERGRRRNARRDPVSPELRLQVFERDGGRCMAPSLGGRWEDCWGRLTLEHVKDELRAAVRAPSDMGHLITLCQGHTEPGAKAGFQWNTNAENRILVRAYLEEVS